ncbi:NAD(P)H-quinone oxidoreductase [Bdellovibrio svalbardensis]|uniref:NAD(P)H-quinone oxidoreductase n=1 Tax=Bdellovibrio svalbardensis TaxID=2972972 RepID=A0ABT6DKA6_9BACT|nr:NAD(P)H-quinone oxidoreductase [Bdellovibrio svalbardensis]MDG0817243.1 NAD(P)H-quinone oxidoreductase [Bdellovibrio svalbardensis]
MKCINMEKPGGPEVLQIQERETPKPAAGEVLLEVYAAGINRPDCFQRMGSYPPPPGASDILGLEVSGKVIACGDGVQRWKVGDSVCALLAGGGYAQYAVAPEGQCLPLPKDFDFVHAAALPETFFTVWTNVFEDGRLQNGESILIHGGAGGIGTTAIQMASALGARVFTTVGKKESVSICEELGAERVILYKEEDFVSVVKEATQNGGVDVILDMVGGDYFTRNVEALANQGRLVQIATLQGAKVELDLRKMMAKRLTLTGSTLRARAISEKTRIAQALEKNVWPLLNQGKMKPVIFKTLPLEKAAEAHALMESSQHTGKIVLKVKD